MPEAPLYIESKAWERVERSCAAILQARDADVPRRPRVVMAEDRNFERAFSFPMAAPTWHNTAEHGARRA